MIGKNNSLNIWSVLKESLSLQRLKLHKRYDVAANEAAIVVSEQEGLTIAAPGGVVETRPVVLAYANQDNP